jgi:hypothetical protein
MKKFYLFDIMDGDIKAFNTIKARKEYKEKVNDREGFSVCDILNYKQMIKLINKQCPIREIN